MMRPETVQAGQSSPVPYLPTQRRHPSPMPFSCVAWRPTIDKRSHASTRGMLPRLSGFLARRPGKQDLIDEVLNDVMLTLWQQAGRFDATKRLSTWLFGIARHKAHTARVWAARALPEPLPALPCGGGPDDPKALVLRQEHARTVARALDRLPPEQRTVVMLMYSKAWII